MVLPREKPIHLMPEKIFFHSTATTFLHKVIQTPDQTIPSMGIFQKKSEKVCQLDKPGGEGQRGRTKLLLFYSFIGLDEIVYDTRKKLSCDQLISKVSYGFFYHSAKLIIGHISVLFNLARTS